MRFFLKIISVGFLAVGFQAYEAAATNLWEQNTATVGIDEKWGVFGEFQPRWFDRLSQKQAIILRGAVLYRIDPELRVGLGGAWAPQYFPTRRNEARIFQQVDYQPSSSLWIPAFRGRFEQRFLEHALGAVFRVRGKAQLSWMPTEYGAYVWNEVFFHLNGKPRQVLGGFDQNRFSVGPRAKISWLTIEAGYLLQTLRRTNGSIHSDHGAALNLGANFW